MATLRYFAAAAAASGTPTETLTGDTLGAVLDAAVAAHGPDFERILGRCTTLVNGRQTSDRVSSLPPDATVDVLPPFAGG